MKKIKHFAGYGTVKAGVIKDSSCTLHVIVTGTHERGLRLDDIYDLYYWLVKRFDKSIPSYESFCKRYPMVDIQEEWSIDQDVYHYCFTY